MDLFELLCKLLAIIGPAVIGLFGYQQYQIRNIQQDIKEMATIQDVQREVDIRMEYIKEKIDDNIHPLMARLDRLDRQIDKLVDTLDRIE